MFSKTRIQDKETQLKKDYRAIKTILQRSGVSWNNDASMINTTTDIWDEIIEEDAKLRRYEKKSFPLFESLDLLYEGQLAEGKICFTSSKPQTTPCKSSEAGLSEKTHIDFTQKNPWTVPINVGSHSYSSDGERHSPLRFDETGPHGWDNESVGTQGMEKQSTHHPKKRSSKHMLKNFGRQGLFTEQKQHDHGKTINLSDNDDDEQEQQSEHRTSSRSETTGPANRRPKRRTDEKVVPRIEETMSDFMRLKREQAAVKA